MSARLPNWESRLAAYLHENRATAFVWGAHDCCLHAANVVALMTGEDPAAAQRATYATAAEARAMLRRDYRGSAWNVPAAHGLQPVALVRAQRGDLVGAAIRGRRALGGCAGAKSYFVGRDGWVTLPTLECAKAWRVG